MDRTHLPYRPCAGAALFNARGQVFLGRRRGRKGRPESDLEWQMPQGGIDEGEDPEAAARRELYEETNVRSVELIGEAPGWLSYDLPVAFVGGGWTQRYRGQTQKWFAYRLTGPESEIDIASPGNGAFKPEFGLWRWEELEALPGLIVAFKRPVYEEVVAAFRHLAGPAA